MKPHNDDYLSNFSKPITEQVVYSAPNLPPPDGSFSKQYQVKESTSNPQRVLSRDFGLGLKIGFSVLMLIWVIEIIGEWNSIEDSKTQYYNPPQSTDDVTYEHAVCDPDTNLYDVKLCQDRMFEDSIDARVTDMVIEMVKVGAWGLIWVSLARVVVFANISAKVIKSQV